MIVLLYRRFGNHRIVPDFLGNNTYNCILAEHLKGR